MNDDLLMNLLFASNSAFVNDVETAYLSPESIIPMLIICMLSGTSIFTIILLLSTVLIDVLITADLHLHSSVFRRTEEMRGKQYCSTCYKYRIL